MIVDASAQRRLPLGAADGFVLSRIDGRTSERELANQTGLPEMQIRTSLEKLLGLKVIDFGGSIAPVPSKPGAGNTAPPAGAPPSGSKLLTSAPAPVDANAGVANSLLAAAIAGVPDTAPELAEAVDLTPEVRRRILGLHSVLASLDHYALLGLGREADKKAVKRTYFELAAVFHPDRYFRKNLGSFKPKMEAIFAKVSGAYETLADKEQRAEYDAYLGDVEKSRDVESMLRNVMAEVESAEQSIREQAQGAPGAAPTAPSSSPQLTPNGSGSYPAVTSPPPPLPQKSTAVSDQLRREALAARLKGGVRPTTKPPVDSTVRPLHTPVATITPTSRASASDAVDALKRRYEDRMDAGRRQQADKYVKLGELAESRNDLTAAAAAFRVALTFLRADEPSYAHAKEVIGKSEQSLSETYIRQAEHEERANRWEDAVRSWGRASKLRPNDHHCLERYAHALVRSNGDLHEAAQCAQKAVALAPTVGDYRCTLATVYLAAGLALNARRELEAAAQQFPDNPNIPVLLKKVQKPA